MKKQKLRRSGAVIMANLILLLGSLAGTAENFV